MTTTARTMKNTTRVTFLGLALLLIIATIFYGIGPDFGIEGDDIYTISDQLRAVFGGVERGYTNIAQSRNFLQISINAIYELTGKSIVLTQSVFFLIWTLNGFLCLLLLSKYYDRWLSLLASLLFVGYTGKYEIVPIMSGGMYHFVVALFLCCLLLMASDLKWKVKSVLVTVLYWISLHWYEILVPLAPLVPVSYYISVRAARRKVRLGGLLISSLPLFVTAFHVILLSRSPIPIWNRSGSLTVLELEKLLPRAFAASLNSIAGERHFSIVADNAQSIRDLYEMGGYRDLLVGNVLLAIAVASVALVVALRGFRQDDRAQVAVPLVEYWALPLLGAYLVLVCPLISIPVFKGSGFVASRFTYLPGLGISFILCGLAACRHRGARYGAIALLSFLTLAEIVSMRMVLFQYSTAAIYDNDIRSQLMNYSLNLKTGDTVFISIPENGMIHRVWKQGFSKFESGGAQSLLMLDNPQLLYSDSSVAFDDRLAYTKHIRKKNTGTDDYFLGFFDSTAPSADKLFPFFYTQDNRLCAVNSVVVVDRNGSALQRKVISSMQVPNGSCVKEIAVPQAIISDLWVDGPRQIQVFPTPHASGTTIRVSGELFAGDPSFESYIKYKGNTIATRKTTEVGKFSWDVILPPANSIYNLEIGNSVPPGETRRVLWKVLDIDVVP